MRLPSFIFFSYFLIFYVQITQNILHVVEYEDIGQSREWEDIEYINKGWSDDKKYKIKTRENEELLLKISDIGQFAKKKKEFEIIKDLEEKKILMPKAVDIGVCNNDQSIYSLYTWIKGEDAAEEISKFSEEEQYKLGVNAGRYLKEIHSVNAPKSIEDWESRFNRKILWLLMTATMQIRFL